MYTGALFPVRYDCFIGFDSSTPEGMRGVLGAELKFMGHDRKLSLLPPAPPPQPHRERACTQAKVWHMSSHIRQTQRDVKMAWIRVLKARN